MGNNPSFLRKVPLFNNIFSTRRIKREPIINVMIFLVAAIILIFILFPIFNVLRRSIYDAQGNFLGLSQYIRFVSTPYFRSVFYNTMRISIVATIGAVLLGTIYGFAITRTNIPGKRIFMTLGILPMIAPPFITAFAVILFLGRRGMINEVLNSFFGFTINIYGWHGVVFAQIITLFPLAYLITSAAFSGLSSDLEESARDLGAKEFHVLRTITFPLVFPSIMNATLLVFMTNLAAFGAPALLGGGDSTLAVEAVTQILGVFNWEMGATIAIILMIPSFIFFYLQERTKKKGTSFVTITGKPSYGSIQRVPRQIKIPAFIICCLTSIVVASLYIVVLLGSFARTWGADHSFTLDHYIGIFTRSLDSIINSSMYSLIGAVGSGIIGLLISYLVVRQRFMGRRLMDSGGTLPYAVPGTLIGLGFVMSFNTPPLALTGTSLIIIISFIIRRMPFAFRTGYSNLQQIDVSIEEASADLGAAWFTSFRKVVLPLLKPAFFSGFVFAFIRAMTELTDTIFLVSPRHRLMAVDIYQFIEYGRLGMAAAMSTVLMVIVIIVVLVLYKLTRIHLFKF